MSDTDPAFSQLRIRQLEMVCALADAGSLRTASERMHQCAPALSKSLKQMESLVGQPLFIRSPRGLVTTSAGEHFIRQARSMLNQLRQLRVTLSGSVEVQSSMLTIGSAATIAWCILPESLRRLSHTGNLPRIRLVEGRIVTLAEQLAVGELDAIVMLATPESLAVLKEGSLIVDQIHCERMVVVAARAHRATMRTMSWKALREMPWILSPPTHISRTIVQQGFLQAGEIPPEPIIESTNIPAMLRFAEEGLGLTAAPYYTVRREIASGSLREVRTTSELASVPIGFAYRKSAVNLAKLHLLRDAVRVHIGGATKARPKKRARP